MELSKGFARPLKQYCIALQYLLNVSKHNSMSIVKQPLQRLGHSKKAIYMKYGGVREIGFTANLQNLGFTSTYRIGYDESQL
jgi:CRISPR/Cas system CMR-associated protein Cmr3 (group 5 of RAMP superfamily)